MPTRHKIRDKPTRHCFSNSWNCLPSWLVCGSSAFSQRHSCLTSSASAARATALVHNRAMALVVFLRGVNVGGHRTFRPSQLAQKLRDYDIVNVGAAGTFVVRKPGARSAFRNELVKAMPFQAEIVVCDGRDILRLETKNPFALESSTPEGSAPQPDSNIVWFVSILSKAGCIRETLPVSFPSEDEWLVRVLASQGQFVFGMYRRHMKTIGYLGRIDKLFNVPATTRNWNTMISIIRILKGGRLATSRSGARS